MDPFYNAVLPLVGVGLGSAVTYIIARKGREIDVLTKGRQRWLDALRDDLAELYEARFAYADNLEAGSAGAKSEAAKHALSRLRLLRGRVLLRLDEAPKARPSTRPQILFGTTVREFSDENGTLIKDLSERLISHGQAVIDAAWAKVKRLE